LLIGHICPIPFLKVIFLYLYNHLLIKKFMAVSVIIGNTLFPKLKYPAKPIPRKEKAPIQVKRCQMNL